DRANQAHASSSPVAESPSAEGHAADADADTDADATAGPGPGSQRDAASREPLPPGLYVIPTPIGNLQDVTLRAADTLRRVNLLLAEDTRHTRKLLNHLGIRNLEMLSYHEHNEKLRLARVLQRLQQGEPVGLVSDAGMPGISDPGHTIVAAAVAAGVRVVALPGPCAFVTALVGSGLPTDAFTFAGFLPPKSAAASAAALRHTSPRRAAATQQQPQIGLSSSSSSTIINIISSSSRSRKRTLPAAASPRLLGLTGV
ncbi:Ribosomal RNA small subunit methyltransferase I, partial [Tetrabaena socialis]